MPFPAEHYYLAFGGALGSIEQWSTGLRFSAALMTDTQAGEQEALGAAMSALNTEWVKTSSPIGSQAKLQWGKLNRIGIDGRYARPYTNVLDQVSPAAPRPTTLPLQCSLVVTLRTGITRGLASKGRIYLPAPSVTLGAPDQVMNPAATQLSADWAAGVLTALNNATGLSTVVVMSSVREGGSQVVTGVDVGSVIDTMRSRRSSLLEARSEATVGGSGAGGSF